MYLVSLASTDLLFWRLFLLLFQRLLRLLFGVGRDVLDILENHVGPLDLRDRQKNVHQGGRMEPVSDSRI